MSEWFESDELTEAEQFELYERRDQPRPISTMTDDEFRQSIGIEELLHGS